MELAPATNLLQLCLRRGPVHDEEQAQLVTAPGGGDGDREAHFSCGVPRRRAEEVVAAWSFIQRCMQHNPPCVYVLENPDTVAWSQVPVLQPHLHAGEFHRIQYGDYGWPLLKPTAIVTNLAAWEPEPREAERSRVKWDDAPPNIKPRGGRRCSRPRSAMRWGRRGDDLVP